MKLLFVENGVHLGCLEMEGSEVTIKKYKPEFQPKVVDAPEEDDHDDESGHEENESDEMKAKEAEIDPEEYEDEDEEKDKESFDEYVKGKKTKAMVKSKRRGLF